ncbi:MAG TPA: EAL domain-containing protein, partial [Gammaproteobacteria bacterium]|nr:EAL domain-containing protein [Gammaproteobacteria bacterium]
EAGDAVVYDSERLTGGALVSGGSSVLIQATDDTTIAAIAGAIALAGLWWASGWVIRDNMREWGEQWLDNLDDLAVPFYLPDDGHRYARADAYVREFGEVLFVRYYSAEGELAFTEAANGAAPALAPIERDKLGAIAGRPIGERRYVLDAVFPEMPFVRIAKPVWTRSVRADGLLGFDPDASAVDETLVGYVELGLDFSSYQTYLVRSTLTAALIGGGLLFLLMVASWLVCRRALRPLAALQASLRRLARGRTNVSVVASGHREISAIAHALNTTASALDERDKELARLAHGDALTGLPNRDRFSELLQREVESAAESGRVSALLLVGVDQFKHVNDSLGHTVGDGLLKLVAETLVASVRPQDTVARFCGDEFVVLLRDVSNEETAATCAELVKRVQDRPFVEQGRSFSVRCSVGAAMIRGACEPASLLSRADMACRLAKTNGGNQFRFYLTTSQEVAEMAADAYWLEKLRTALKTDGFVLHYQPIVKIRTQETMYYEVLLRMLVDGELESPATFIAAATRLGLMAELDQWVIRHALRSLAEQRAAHGDVRFTLNVSGSTFERADFFSYLQSEARASGVPLDAIVIEITEQIAVRNLGAAATQMAELVERGCRFAIDDFGSGYCSYSYLKELPVAFVKIDGTFIVNLTADIVDRKIVAAISEIAAATFCETIAEHVENDETLRLLAKLGITYAQGYLLGRPSPSIEGACLPAPVAAKKRRRVSDRQAAAPCLAS